MTPGAFAILAVLGAVVVGIVCWLGYQVRREAIRRRQVTRVRAAVEPRPTVAELRERCGADTLPRYPTPTVAAGDPDLAASVGSNRGDIA
ncbi:hypothetical protein Lesp02_15700 [Lentzea sp. NBRC 105346]|uniref:hypothetical protein n=1 Tax=Lentzea sp. NBRC 105346 TaxID=3032205 RepID=UPI0024A4E48D|nr:hypothetical protein [Lentzea sp. NBRC 105346]GLZ29380.1 hypothetical protein Lesp02_15700 [Lentzea sp. NBRC 105346]